MSVFLGEYQTLSAFDHSEKWIAQKLGVSIYKIRSTIRELIEMKWVEFKDKKFALLVPASESTQDHVSESIKLYHKQILKKAADSLHEVSLDQREFLTTTLAVRSDKVQEAKKYLRKFHRDFLKEYCNPEEAKDAIFQLSLQFFKLDKQYFRERL